MASIGCYKIVRFKLGDPDKWFNTLTYFLISLILNWDTNRLGNALRLGLCVVLKLIFHASSELLMGWEIDASWEGLSGRGIGCLSVGLAIDVFTGNSWDVAGIACNCKTHAV